jgi:hypothetical protein
MSWRDLPVGIASLDELARLLNERFADSDPQNWDAGGSRVKNVGEPRAPGDALSLSQADRRYLKIGWTPVIETVKAIASTMSPPSPGTGGGAVVFLLEETLSGSGVTLTHGDGSLRSILVAAITQSPTGDTAISWGPNFRTGTPVDVSPDPDKLTTYVFQWISGKWTILCAPFQHF